MHIDAEEHPLGLESVGVALLGLDPLDLLVDVLLKKLSSLSGLELSLVGEVHTVKLKSGDTITLGELPWQGPEHGVDAAFELTAAETHALFIPFFSNLLLDASVVFIAGVGEGGDGGHAGNEASPLRHSQNISGRLDTLHKTC